MLWIASALALPYDLEVTPGAWDSAPFQRNGNANIISGNLRLTPNTDDRAGTAWLTTPLSLAPGEIVKITAEVEMDGGSDDADGDGMTVTFQTQGTDVLGGDGNNLGIYGAVDPALTIELDTWDLPSETDDWLGVNLDGDMVSADGNTVTVKYDGDFSSAFVLNVLASRPASIVDEVLVTANAVGDDMGNAWLNTHSAGSGPFVMSDYRPAEIVRLTANENYFRGAPAMKSIIIRHVAEAATQQLLLTTGDVDIAKNLTPDQIAGLSTDKIKVETYPQAAVHFLSFNQKDEDLTPPAVWEAARYLVDYDGMTQSFLKGQMEIHQAFWPKGFPGSYDETPFTHDVEKAKKILADAGVKTPIDVTLDVINASPFTDMAQSLQATFAEAGVSDG